MPIYEYQCADCDSMFELLVRASEIPVCPHCDGQRLAKQLSVASAPKSSSSSMPMAPRSNLGAG